jgi:hypothetical protein
MEHSDGDEHLDDFNRDYVSAIDDESISSSLLRLFTLQELFVLLTANSAHTLATVHCALRILMERAEKGAMPSTSALPLPVIQGWLEIDRVGTARKQRNVNVVVK